MTKKLFKAVHKETKAEIEFDLWDIDCYVYEYQLRNGKWDNKALLYLSEVLDGQDLELGENSFEYTKLLKDYNLFLQIEGRLIPYETVDKN